MCEKDTWEKKSKMEDLDLTKVALVTLMRT